MSSKTLIGAREDLDDLRKEGQRARKKAEKRAHKAAEQARKDREKARKQGAKKRAEVRKDVRKAADEARQRVLDARAEARHRAEEAQAEARQRAQEARAETRKRANKAAKEARKQAKSYAKEARKRLEDSPVPTSADELRDLGESVRGSLEEGLTSVRKDLAARIEPEEPKKRRRWGLWIAVIALLGVGAAVVATRREPELPPPPPPAPRPRPVSTEKPAGAPPVSPAQASSQEIPTHTATDAVSGSTSNGAVSSDKPATGGKE
ncbi:hypothetical protein ACFPK1_00320 [Actinomycetospora rhizophila]|uniref:Uncharacterized protein n=1 Tax=Actinomycetospora rhizophila TaxID=1416876 RepID=A0ABV9Z982_9PSEU